MKNKKLNLSELKVKSFVTDLENEKGNTIKGGSMIGNTDCCGTLYSQCNLCNKPAPSGDPGGTVCTCE